MKIILALTIALIFIISADATFWSSRVTSNSTSWSIQRQSQNLSFDCSQSVQGKVSPVDYHGRRLGSYHSGYQELKVNDVRLRERTSAMPGNYSFAEDIYLRSYTTNSIAVSITKQADSPILTVNYAEEWPVILKSVRSIEYSGKGINDREFAGNNLDYVGSDFLYNKELSAQTNVGLLLKRMNATVLGLVTNDTLVSANFMPGMETRYRMVANTSGIADLKYRLTGSSYDFVPGIYPAIIEGEERYVGNYHIARSLHIKSDFENATPIEYGYPCCFAGYSDLFPLEGADFLVSAKEVFDCSCCRVP